MSNRTANAKRSLQQRRAAHASIDKSKEAKVHLRFSQGGYRLPGSQNSHKNVAPLKRRGSTKKKKR